MSEEHARYGDPEISIALNRIQSEDLEEVLNLIDQLRSEGIGKFVDLPQLIVCGDQSSGKSSVLEAISGLNFPRKDGICTRFATELILRRAPESMIKASINPDEDRPEKEKSRLRKFQKTNINLTQFSQIVEDAGRTMKVGEEDLPFSKDILRVEICGPQQPHLTLVDLPGLYHGPDEQQNTSGIAYVESLVRSYIENPRSVILAVISAKNELALQKITTLTREVDSEGKRTLGVITKPDTLSKDSATERSFRLLSENRNKQVVFQLGWHVLKNRAPEEEDFSLAQRNESEAKFLSQGIWESLPRKQIGIQSLIPRLSAVLKNHILSQMPSFISDTHASLKEAKSSLQKLGATRQTLAEQRKYLLRGSEGFTVLVNNSLDGNYSEAFFGKTFGNNFFKRRLRAVVRDRLLHFAHTMDDRGEYMKIIDEGMECGNRQRCIYRTDYVEEVRHRLRWSRGRELPGNFNFMIVGELFYQQTQPWEGIVDDYIVTLLDDVRTAVMFMLQQVLDRQSVEGVLKHIIHGKLSELEDKLRAKTAELLNPQQTGHPITYNSQYTKTIQEKRDQHLRNSIIKKLRAFFGEQYPTNPHIEARIDFRMQALVDSLTSDTETDMERFACSEAIDCMLAYYQVAMTKFVDDFSMLAVEKCLLEPLLHIFSPSVVDTMKDEVIEDIAREDGDTETERRRLTNKVAVLDRSWKYLQQLDKKDSIVSQEMYKVNNEVQVEKRAAVLEDNHSIGGTGIELTSSAMSVTANAESLDEMSAELVDAVNGDTSGDPITSATHRVSKKKKHKAASLWEDS